MRNKIALALSTAEALRQLRLQVLKVTIPITSGIRTHVLHDTRARSTPVPKVHQQPPKKNLFRHQGGSFVN